jgi:hypothetical protein
VGGGEEEEMHPVPARAVARAAVKAKVLICSSRKGWRGESRTD